MQKFDSLWLEDRLKRIAAQLIEAHRNGNQDVIAHYARRVPDIQKCSPKRQFMQLIQVFHPDRLVVYIQQVSDLQAGANAAGLEGLASLLEYEALEGMTTARRQHKHDAGNPEDFGGTGETYEYGEDDFGYDEESERDDESGSDEYETPDTDEYEYEDPFAEGSFMDAIKREFFGNLELYPTRFEIEQFEGELDLSDYGLNDLAGVEFCVNINSLNLAMNQIDNVWSLKELSRLEFLDLSSNALENADDLRELAALKDLDLSFNDIDDVAFLLDLASLKCVSLVGNPVKNRNVLEELKRRGVTVII